LLSRRLAREIAFKVLFQVDLAGARPESSLGYLLEEMPLQEKYCSFARELVHGTLAELGAIDRRISKYSPEWNIERMPTVDRNLMRLAVYEILYTDIDPAIAIDEAVELAKTYGDENSKGFINAILDRISGEKDDEIGARD